MVPKRKSPTTIVFTATWDEGTIFRPMILWFCPLPEEKGGSRYLPEESFAMVSPSMFIGFSKTVSGAYFAPLLMAISAATTAIKSKRFADSTVSAYGKEVKAGALV